MSTVTVEPAAPAGDLLSPPPVPPVVPPPTPAKKYPTPGERFILIVLVILAAVGGAFYEGDKFGEARGRKEIAPPVVHRVCPYDCRWCRWQAAKEHKPGDPLPTDTASGN